jgi:tetraacyldisaccharide 4'-kinase
MKIPLPFRVLLWPLSWIYGVVARIRARLYEKGILARKRLKAPVISVGNLTVGGTGKTPMVLWLARKFLAEGKRVAILSRGYRGSGGTSDEIELLKRRLGCFALFGVGRDRHEEGRKIEEKQHVDVFLLDDGFQHLKLARDVNILMLDGSRKLRKQWLLPVGVLREPISACRRADIIVVTRKHERPDVQPEDSEELHIFYAPTRLLGFRRAGTEGIPCSVNELGAGPFLAFCGIGNPDAFFSDLKRWGLPLAGKMSFRDHHSYSANDVRRLEEAAERSGGLALVTTEKDEQNLPGANFTKPVYVAVIDLDLQPEREFSATLERLLLEHSGWRA